MDAGRCLAGWPDDPLRPAGRCVHHAITGGEATRFIGGLSFESQPTWSPDGRFIVYTTWTSSGGHIKRVAATGGAPETLTRNEGYYLDPVYMPDGARVVFLAGAASDQLYSILMDTPPETEGEDGLEAPREIGGVDPPNTLEIRWMPATGGAATVVASAQNGRGPHFTRNDSSRVYLTTNRGLQSITMDGYDRRTHLRITGAGPGNNPGRETVEVRIQGRGENTTVPVNQGSMSFFEKPMDRRRCS